MRLHLALDTRRTTFIPTVKAIAASPDHLLCADKRTVGDIFLSREVDLISTWTHNEVKLGESPVTANRAPTSPKGGTWILLS